MVKKINITIVLLVSFSFLSFNNVFSKDLGAYKERTLAKILDDFGDKYDVFFSYEKSMVKDIKLDFEFIEDEEVYSALDRLLSSLDLAYDTFGEKYIVIYKKSEAAGKDLTKLKRHFKEIEKIESKGRIKIFKRKNKKTISMPDIVNEVAGFTATFESIRGRVTDDSGNPLIGASIVIGKTSTGTVTDLDGNFSLEVTSFPVTLNVSYTGYADQAVIVNNAQTDLTIVLEEGLSLEEVLVTSRKREESLQDVPIAITAISGSKLEAMDAQDITATAGIAPNVNFSYGGTSSGSSSAAVVYIRGVGQNDFVPTVDPGVGIYLDGVYLGRSVGAVLDLADVKRVEVLRGPQGTLFGRNTIGGAISLTSNDPADDFSGNVRITGGSFTRFESSAVFNIPFSDKVKSSISLLQKRRDGYVTRTIAGDDLGDENMFGLRTALMYKPTDKFKLKVSFDYSLERENSAAEEQLSAVGVFPGIVNGSIGDEDCLTPDCVQNQVSNIPFTTNETGPNLNDTDALGISLTADYELSENLLLKSITAYRDLSAEFARASDGTPFDIFATEDEYEQDQFSQELQLIGGNDQLDFIAGAYFFKEEGFNAVIASADATGIPVFPFDIGGSTDNTSFALFGEATFHVKEKLHLTGGLRYTTETKGYDPFAINALGGENVTPGLRELDFDQLTWRAIVAYDLSESLNTYISASKGFKSGGFDVRYTQATEDLEPTSFLPETVLSYEVGFKTDFQDADLRLNIAAFYSDYENIQVSINPPGGVATRTVNGAEADMIGIEIEFDWSPTKNLIIDGSLGFIDAEYKELSEGSELSLEDEFIRTPKSTYKLGASYLIKLGTNGSLTPRFSLTSQNDIHFEPVNNEFVFEDGYNNINLSATYKTGNGKFDFTVGVNNLTDERYLVAGDSNGTIGYALGIFALPRTWYGTARYNF